MLHPGRLVIPLFLLLSGISTPVCQLCCQTVNTESLFVPSEKIIYYPLGESKKLPIRISQFGPACHIICLNLHDNETTSVIAARSILEKQGGKLIKIENQGQRLIRFALQGRQFAFDPNSTFSRTGIEKSLKENGPFSEAALNLVEQFGHRLLELIPDSAGCVIALHNNTNGAYSVNSYLPGGERRHDAAAVHISPGQDPDDMIFTTDRGIFYKIAAAGFNAVLQDNLQATEDGSLSVYCGKYSRCYVNLETEHGKISQYTKMFEKLLGILDFRLPSVDSARQ